MGFSVGETLASAVVKEVVNMIRVAAEREASLLWSFKDDLGAMGDTLETINAALRDADAAQGPAPAKSDERTLLLGRLKAAAHDIEDLLEEFADAGTRRPHSSWFREVRVFRGCLKFSYYLKFRLCVTNTNPQIAISKVCILSFQKNPISPSLIIE